MKRNMLIVLEGISGSGKSSVLAEILEMFHGHNYEIVYFKWNQVAGIKRILSRMQARNIRWPSIYAILEWISFSIGYRKMRKNSKKENVIIICDRYLYTGITRERTNHAVIQMGNIFLKLCRQPDLVVFMDVEPEICLERIIKRGKRLFCQNRRIRKNCRENEELEYLKESQKEYRKLFKHVEEKYSVPIQTVCEQDKHKKLKYAVRELIVRKASETI